MAKLTLTSPAFKNMSDIPRIYTCQGKDISPPLVISNVPKDTQSLVIICVDPDATTGMWDHWVLFNIHPYTTEIPVDWKPQFATLGTNTWGKIGYGGPCPAKGKHRYVFRLYAIKVRIDLETGATKKDVEKKMKGKIIEQTELIGLYQKS